MRKPAAVFAAALLLLLTACTVRSEYSPPVLQPGEGSDIKETPALTVPAEEPAKAAEGITIALTGDMMFDGYVGGVLKSKGGDYLFEGYKEYLGESDMVFGNLETCISHRGKPMEDKQYTFRSSSLAAAALKKHNFTAVSVANNHVLDYGYEAFEDTLKALEDNGILYAGGGRNKQEARRGAFIEKNGIKVGFIAFSRIVPVVDWYAGDKKPGIIGAYKVHEPEVLKLIAELKSKCDILVVSVHWGKEGTLEARVEETETARKMVDAGADIIMGHHPHVVQGIEMYKGKPIFYSLGNFIFTGSRSELGNKTVLAEVRINGEKKVEAVRVIPGMIKSGRPLPMDEKQGRDFMEHLNRYNINFELVP